MSEQGKDRVKTLDSQGETGLKTPFGTNAKPGSMEYVEARKREKELAEEARFIARMPMRIRMFYI